MPDKINVLLTRPFLQSDLDYLAEAVDGLVFHSPSRFDEVSILHFVKSLTLSIDVAMGPPPSRAVLEELKDGLNYIQIPWSGVESINFSDCEELAIPVANSHGNSTSVAEMAVALLMSIGKAIPFHDRELRSGNWHRPGSTFGFHPPQGLSGSTIGLFGYGAINKAVSKLIQGFNVKVITCSNKVVESDFVDESYITDSDFIKFISKCDYIVIGAPLTTKTKAIFDASAFRTMKADAFLINVSRGGIVCDSSLFSALKTGEIAGAAIDTWNEPPPRGDDQKKVSQFDFDSLDNIVMSPHRAGFIAGELPHLVDVIENFQRFKVGLTLMNLVDFTKGY